MLGVVREYYEKITTADTLSEPLCVRGLPDRLRSKDAPSGIRKRKSANRAAMNPARARHLGMMPVLPHRRQESLEDRTYVPSRRVSTASRSSSTARLRSIL